MQVFTIPQLSALRPAFVEAFPVDLASHRDAQKAMFGAAREAGLDTKGDEMIEGINALLGLHLSSRRQLTVDEMHVVTVAIEGGAFRSDWTPRLRAQITVSTTFQFVPRR